MHINIKSALGVFQLFIITTLAILLFILPGFATSLPLPDDSAANSASGSIFGLIGNLITITVLSISEFYYAYIHGTISTIVSALWPKIWPQYEPMLAAYQTLFYKIPLWFTGNFWPTSLLGNFPLWGIDLFLITEIFYIALRLVTRKAAAFKGSWFVKFMKSMVYETWIFIKSPFFAAGSVLFFLLRAEKEKRRILLFWLYTIILTAIVVAIVAWYAQG